jgi:hypothetical protein
LSSGKNRSFKKITPGPSGYTGEYFESIVKNGKLYIKPVQKEIILNEIEIDLDTVVLETCFKCKKKVHEHLLDEHVDKCNSKKRIKSSVYDSSSLESESDSDSDSDVRDVVKRNERKASKHSKYNEEEGETIIIEYQSDHDSLPDISDLIPIKSADKHSFESAPYFFIDFCCIE